MLSGAEAELVGYWNFDLKNYSLAIDQSANQLNGELVGGAYIKSFPRANLAPDILYIEGISLTPTFSPKETEYYATLFNNVKSINEFGRRVLKYLKMILFILI